MNLAVEINTSIVYRKLVAIMRPTRSVCRSSRIFDCIEAGPESHADRNPLIVISLDRSGCVDYWGRGHSPSHQCRCGPGNQKLLPQPCHIYLHRNCLPFEIMKVPTALSLEELLRPISLMRKTLRKCALTPHEIARKMFDSTFYLSIPRMGGCL